MANPYAKYAADRAGKAKAKSYQAGGKVSDPPSLGGKEVERRENYRTGADKLGEGMFGFRMQPGSVLERMKVMTSKSNTYAHDEAVPRKKED